MTEPGIALRISPNERATAPERYAACIEALLARLKELDLETWDRLDGDVQIQTRDWSNIGNPRLLWLMQGVVQEAIVARGLAIDIKYPIEDSDWWGADVGEETSGLSRIRIGPTAVEALLEAYVALLEAQQGAGE